MCKLATHLTQRGSRPIEGEEVEDGDLGKGRQSRSVVESCSGDSIFQNKFYHVNFQHKLRISMITDRKRSVIYSY